MFRRLLSTTTLAVMAGLLAGCTVLTDEDVPSQPPPLTPAAAPTVTASPTTTTGAPLPEPTPMSTAAMPAPTTPQPIPASPATSPEGQLADKWRSLPDAPAALTEVAATAHRGEMWIAGGFDADGRPVASVLIFDPVTAAWRDGPPLPEAVHHSALVSTGDGLFLLGGYVSSRFDSPTAAVRRLDAAGSGWVDADPLPEPRAAGAAAWDGSQLVYGGGVGPDGVSDAVFASDGGGWRDLARLMVAREHLGAASDGAGRVWFLGGRVRGLASNVGVVDLLAAGEVESLGELLTPRSGVAAFWLELTGPCLAGGEGPDGTFDDVECVSEDGSVRSLPRLGSARHGLGAAAFEDAVIVALGGPRPGLFVSAAVEELAISR